MRLRRMAAVAATALTATVMLAAPASAGTGESGYCFDGGWTDVPILSSPITLGVEVRASLTETHIALCYATSPVGSGVAHVTGGLLKIAVRPDGTGYFQCRPDSNPYVVLVGCNGTYDFNPLAGPVSVSLDALVVGLLNAPVATVGKTGVSIDLGLLAGSPADPKYPCIWVDGIQLVPMCGLDIV